MKPPKLPVRALQSPLLLRKFLNSMDRERKHMQAQFSQVRGLMPLLMKPRNKQPWNAADKAELKVHLKRLSQLSPYLVVVMMPGGFFLLPVLSWWLDRRRNRNRPAGR
jgi:hypothetical protein